MTASNIPGYVQGFRFSSANYSGDRFADLSGYGAFVRTINGTPTFETVDGYEGLLLDNTWHGAFWHPNTWQGTCVVVGRYERVSSGTLQRRLITFSNDGATGTLERMSLIYVGADRRVQTNSQSGSLARGVIRDATIQPVALCQDQQRRQGFSTIDGVNVVSSAVVSGTADGRAAAMGSNPNGAILGALQGSSSNTTPEVATRNHIFEMHFFEANPIIDAPIEMETFLSELNSDYS